ncbi:hypothetical protein MLD38_009689 [Melastoma candidum]|uniref:Uncharacterized protein n=1 Tax=Melastoma candidum TaxID=119954 RepID=A0ACB9S223_9MYRT|nr:hypothetical protein MLD38_009689 [Melastoma candidum]
MADAPQKHGFWRTLAKKARSVLDDDADDGDDNHAPPPPPPPATDDGQSRKSRQKRDGPAFPEGLDALTSSLSYIGNAVEEGLAIVENRASGIIQEARMHVGNRKSSFKRRNYEESRQVQKSESQVASEMEQEIQLKASRDVAMAMAAKAKLLLRELKTVKADLAFAKERCAQLEEENRILRENREMGNGLDDEDLVRLQLETLLVEKARLAHENSIYARENRFLREVVEYHQLTMQDVVYLDERAEVINEVVPSKTARGV